MPSLKTVWRFVCDVFEDVQQTLSHSYTIEILEETDTQLILQSSSRHTVLNKRYGTVKSRSQTLARFDEIKCIDINYQAPDEGPATWTVSLNLSWCAAITIGETDDSTDASIIAARLSSFTGKQVRSL
jgi:hypothetical protein